VFCVAVASSCQPLSVYSHIIDDAKLIAQLDMLPSVVETVNDIKKQENKYYIPLKQVTSVRSLTELLSSSGFAKNLCSEVYKLCIIYMTVPMTSATAERSFSTMRRIKTYLRQTMGQQRLNDVMLLHIHKQRTDQIDLKSVAQAFVMANDERIRYFGNPSR
jgi:hypothetical protein